MSVPIVDSLADIYPADAVAAQTQRWQHLAAVFAERFGAQPDFVARSPGRVNVIGEHIDYSLYSVLPMAITGDCIIAVRAVNSDAPAAGFSVDIANVLADRFPAHSFAFADGEVDIDASVLEWTNYFKSGLKGAIALLRQKNSGLQPKSLQVVMDGTVPVGGGLSSSAAFTSASALAVMYANAADPIDKTELTEVAIVSERNVGVNSGGMDQSASVFALAGSALFVTFTPALTARPVFFPATQPELCFLIAQSFVTANKFVTGPIHYNLRVVECTLAAAYLNVVASPPGTALPADNGPLGVSLHGFQQAYFGKTSHKSQKEQLQDMLAVTAEYLPDAGYTREQIAAALHTTVDDLNARYMARFPVRAEQFKLRQRATHVFSEALRVLEFMEVLESGRADISAQLGDLMNATQTSCRELYECSCAELDELCRIARDAGSFGSRLTGAGWGGCSVHLVPVERVEAVRAAWDEHYYSKRQLTPEQKEGAVIVSRPGSGSAVFTGRV